MSKKEMARAIAMTIIGLCFFLNLPNMVLVYFIEYYKVFSGAKPMAQAIQQVEKEERIFEKGFVIVVSRKKAIGLQPYLPGVKFWNPCTRDFADYFMTTRALAACDQLSPSQVIEKTKEYFGNLNKKLLLFDAPLPYDFDGDYYYQKIYAVDRLVFGYTFERFFLYLPMPKTSSQATLSASAQDFSNRTGRSLQTG